MDYATGALYGSLIVGTLCGILPLIVGLMKGSSGSAVTGFILCIAAGFLLGIMGALPVSIVTTVMIACKKPKMSDAEIRHYYDKKKKLKSVEFKFMCSNCNQSLSATADMVGKIFECPSCQSKIKVPFELESI